MYNGQCKIMDDGLENQETINLSLIGTRTCLRWAKAKTYVVVEHHPIHSIYQKKGSPGR